MDPDHVGRVGIVSPKEVLKHHRIIRRSAPFDTMRPTLLDVAHHPDPFLVGIAIAGTKFEENCPSAAAIIEAPTNRRSPRPSIPATAKVSSSHRGTITSRLRPS